MNKAFRYMLISLFLIASAFFVLRSIAHGHESPDAATAFDTPWKDDQVIEIPDLAKWISAKQRPLVLQVGVQRLYDAAHVPGAVFAGPAEEEAGLAELKAKANPIARTRDIVIYCGCCPMKVCPNLKPAFTLLQGMGFKKVKVLDVPHDFTSDWLNKSLPVERRSD